jgi:hypothetical protein
MAGIGSYVPARFGLAKCRPNPPAKKTHATFGSVARQSHDGKLEANSAHLDKSTIEPRTFRTFSLHLSQPHATGAGLLHGAEYRDEYARQPLLAINFVKRNCLARPINSSDDGAELVQHSFFEKRLSIKLLCSRLLRFSLDHCRRLRRRALRPNLHPICLHFYVPTHYFRTALEF